MDLKLYDTLSREKRVFAPLDPANVRMYVCGPTVYDFAHIGNARPVIVFDVLYRLLRHLYGESHVKYVRNITDVDDKINARAAERGIPIRELTEETYRNFKEDVAALGCLPPDVEPRATEHIEEMKILIERLVASGHAYVAEEHVLFSVPSMKDYGQLSKRPLDEMIAGARVDVAPYKRHDQDFVLWKPSKESEPGWPSPSEIKTPGRPGWHIECSAMSWKHLGETFDIHGGGIDLVFPHHENEIAQSRCAFHTGVMANTWMHNGFLQVEGEKMSKSLGNFVTIRELLADWSGGAVRFAMLQTHYRQPINWTVAKLREAREEIGDWVSGFYDSDAEQDMDLRGVRREAPKPSSELAEILSDDLNTPQAITHLRGLFADRDKKEKYSRLIQDCEFLGIFTPRNIASYSHGISGSVKPGALSQNYDLAERIKVAVANGNVDFIESASAQLIGEGIEVCIEDDGHVTLESNDSASPDEIERLISARNEARKAKNWAESDRIRDELAAMGVVLKDSKDGTTWEIAR